MLSKKTKNTIVKTSVLCSTVVCGVLISQEATKNIVYADTIYTTSANLNLRKGPGINNSRITVIPNNTQISVKNFTQNGWANVVWNGYKGYVAKEYLVSNQNSNVSTNNFGSSLRRDGYHMYTNASLNFRLAPTTSSKIIGIVPKNKDVLIISRLEIFTKLSLKVDMAIYMPHI